MPADATRIGFVGVGHVARVLAPALADHGFRVVAVTSRNTANAQRLADQLPAASHLPSVQAVADTSDLVFLTIADDALASVAHAVRWRSAVLVAHCSGAHEVSVLQAAADRGASIGSFHPLLAFADPEIARNLLPGCSIAIEGTDPLRGLLTRMALALGAHPVDLPPGSKALYHASGSFVSGAVAPLMVQAMDLWAAFGVPADVALAALMPLLRATVAAVGQTGPVGALAGPIARGDVGTVQRHLQALAEAAPDALPLYRLLGQHAVPIAVAQGTISAERAREITRLLSARVENGATHACA